MGTFAVLMLILLSTELDPVSASASVWAIPWPQLVVLLLVLLLIAGLIRRRARRRGRASGGSPAAFR